MYIEGYVDVERDEDGVPKDALPGFGGKLQYVYPFDKKARKKGFNWQESSYFGGICGLGSDQIIDCYSSKRVIPIYGERIERYNLLDLSYECSQCKYFLGSGCSDLKHEKKHIAFNKYSSGYIRTKYKDLISDAKSVEKELSSVYPEYEIASGFVYFISDGRFIKIGKAADVKKRLSGIQTGNANKLYVLYEIPCNSMKCAEKLEMRLHWLYKEHCWRGEWFNLMQMLPHEEWRYDFPQFYTGELKHILPTGEEECFSLQ